jgi:hypothetical protein
VNRGQRDTINFDTFKVSALKKSRIYLFKSNSTFLNLQLNNSSFEEDDFFADSINIMANPESKLEMSAGNLVKAKIVPYE